MDELNKVSVIANLGNRARKQNRKGYARWVVNSKESKIYKAVLFALAEGDCPICKKPMVLRFDNYNGDDLATLDHIIPVRDMIKHEKLGLQIMCKLCNFNKN